MVLIWVRSAERTVLVRSLGDFDPDDRRWSSGKRIISRDEVGMREDQIDIFIKLLACDYQRRLVAAKAAFPNNPMAAGKEAQKDLIADIRFRGGTAIQEEPRTGVDSAGGGQSRFDVVFNLYGTDIYLEVQSSDYKYGHKPVQAQGQVIGFCEVAASTGMRARYYKIIGGLRRIDRWSRRVAEGSLSKGDYDPQLSMFF